MVFAINVNLKTVTPLLMSNMIKSRYWGRYCGG